MQPLVSIVTPSLNQARFVQATIESVAAQDYPFIEHIVVDGGSTDGTQAIFASYETVRWLSEPDRGQADAINKGFALARGEIFAWLNSDDIYLPGAIEEAVAAFERHGAAGLIYGDYIKIDELGVELRQVRARDFDLGIEINVGNVIPQPAAFFRAAAFRQVGGLDVAYQYALDYDLWIKIAKSFPVVHERRLWAGFRLHSESKTVARREAFWREERQISRRHGSSFFSPQWRNHLRRRHPRPYHVARKLRNLAELVRQRELRELLRRLKRNLDALLRA